MTLLSFKQKLYITLDGQYPITEIDSFFKIILNDILNLSKIDFALNPNSKINSDLSDKIEIIIKELQEEKPIQHAIGFTEFMDLKFIVNKNVLIPRPETEELIQWVIEDCIHFDQFKILDIGTGSGCIPICLTKNLSKAETTTIDVSMEAIEIAKQNANNNNTTIQFLHQDILTTQKLPQQYDIIISNPPYVRNLEKIKIQKNVLDYEPHLALFVSDNNPLVFYRKIAELAKKHLTSNGILYFEINQYLGKETVLMLTNIGFTNIELKKDMFGNDRMIKAIL